MRRYEEKYRIRESDDVLYKENFIHQDLDLRLDSVEALGQAFAEGNRIDVEAIVSAYRDTVANLAARTAALLDNAVGGVSADVVAETAQKLFLTPERRAQILADIRGGVDTSGDTLSKLLNLVSSITAGAPLGRQTLRDVNDAVVANKAALDLVLGGSDPALDSFAEALTRFVQDEGQLANLMTGLGNRLRFDSTQTIGPSSRQQLRKNAQIDGADVVTVQGATILAASAIGALVVANAPSAAQYTIDLPALSSTSLGDSVKLMNIQANDLIVRVSQMADQAGPSNILRNGASQKSYTLRAGSCVTFRSGASNWYIEAISPIFDSVRQGVGAGQLQNIVGLGWSGTALKASVDTTDLGTVWTDGSAPKVLQGVGYQRLPNGLILNWARVSVSSDTGVSFATAFPNAILSYGLALEVPDQNPSALYGSWISRMSNANCDVRTRVTTGGAPFTPTGNFAIINLFAVGY